MNRLLKQLKKLTTKQLSIFSALSHQELDSVTDSSLRFSGFDISSEEKVFFESLDQLNEAEIMIFVALPSNVINNLKQQDSRLETSKLLSVDDAKEYFEANGMYTVKLFKQPFELIEIQDYYYIFIVSKRILPRLMAQFLMHKTPEENIDCIEKQAKIQAEDYFIALDRMTIEDKLHLIKENKELLSSAIAYEKKLDIELEALDDELERRERAELKNKKLEKTKDTHIPEKTIEPSAAEELMEKEAPQLEAKPEFQIENHEYDDIKPELFLELEALIPDHLVHTNVLPHILVSRHILKHYPQHKYPLKKVDHSEFHFHPHASKHSVKPVADSSGFSFSVALRRLAKDHEKLTLIDDFATRYYLNAQHTLYDHPVHISGEVLLNQLQDHRYIKKKYKKRLDRHKDVVETFEKLLKKHQDLPELDHYRELVVQHKMNLKAKTKDHDKFAELLEEMRLSLTPRGKY